MATTLSRLLMRVLVCQDHNWTKSGVPQGFVLDPILLYTDSDFVLYHVIRNREVEP